jgi:rare lipoprotein A
MRKSNCLETKIVDFKYFDVFQQTTKTQSFKRANIFLTSLFVACQIILLLIFGSNVLADTTPPSPHKKVQVGKASYYCQSFHGKKTSLGTTYNRAHWVAAHPSFPFGTLVRVTHLSNQRHVEVHIVDRGPSRAQRKRGVVIDLSRAAAEKLGMIRQGKARVRLEVLKWGQLKKGAPVDHEEYVVTQS